MTRGKRTWIILLGVAALSIACKSSDDGNSTSTGGKGSSSSGGTSGGTGGSSGGAGSGTGEKCENAEDINSDCPMIPPMTGACASRGKCCHRSENSLKEKDLMSDATFTELEYRMNYVFTTNHELTIGDKLVATLSIQRSDNEEQSTLIRMKLPRMNGKDVEGDGEFTNYVGRYNCDGTYSFYDDTAAPKTPTGLNDDVARWTPAKVKAHYNPAKIGTPDYITIPWSEKANRKLQYVPFVKPAPDFSYDWELVNQGFRLLDFKVGGDGRDCIGKRDGANWTAGGQFELYTPMGPNNKQIISTIQESYCTLVGFGITTDKTLDCEKTARCVPGDSGCAWKKLPDSLCPVTDADIDMFGCHLGDTKNTNKEKNYPTDLKCTMTAPTEPQDPSKVQTVGQCCDPLGKKTDGLPDCNAYRLLNDVVAAAAEITDSTQHGLQPGCM